MVKSLRSRNLEVNATKTKYVHTEEGKQIVKVGDREVIGDREGTVTVGAPVSLAGEVARRWPDEQWEHSQSTKSCSRERAV